MNISNLIRRFSKGIPKEFLITFPKYDCFLQHIALKSPVLEEFINQLSLMKPDTIPILIYRHLESKLTPLDIAIKDNTINSVNMLISILVKYQNNTCFNYLIDPQIITLIEKNVDLKDYFESDLPIHKLKDERFPYLHED